MAGGNGACSENQESFSSCYSPSYLRLDRKPVWTGLSYPSPALVRGSRNNFLVKDDVWFTIPSGDVIYTRTVMKKY